MDVHLAAAYPDQETVASAARAKPYRFVVKPYRVTQVHAALQLALGSSQAGDPGPRRLGLAVRLPGVPASAHW